MTKKAKRTISDQVLYSEITAALDFQIGDKVKVLRKANDGELGWETGWCENQMDERIGTVVTIKFIDADYGVSFKEDVDEYCYPIFVLELIERPNPIKECPVKKLAHYDVTIDGDGVMLDGHYVSNESIYKLAAWLRKHSKSK